MNKIEFLSKMKDPNVYMHITKDLSHNGQFVARVPENRLVGWNEDDETPRVCVAEDINGCLTGTGIDEETLIKVFFIDVEKLKLKDSLITWETLYKEDLVTDSVYTKEAWILKDFKVSQEDSVIVSLNCVRDDESPYLVEYEIQKKADELGIDAIDLYEKKFESRPRCITYLKVYNEDFSILNKDMYEEFWKTTQMLEGEKDCLEEPSSDLYDYEDELEELESFRREYGVEFLGEGNGRKVFAFGNYAVKLPKTEDGELQSKQECAIYSGLKGTLSILNPSYNLFYEDLVFQPRLYQLSESDFNRYNSILDYLKDNDFEADYISTVEKEVDLLVSKCELVKEDLLKMYSWGVRENYDDKVYLLDYGTTEKIFEEYYN